MSTQSNDDEQASPYRPFTKAERIQQLNDIDKSISQLLKTTALALKALSTSKSETIQTPSDRQRAFENATDSFLRTLHNVDVGMRRQIAGLEEAKIIPADKTRKLKEVDGKGAGGRSGGVEVTAENGIGKLDIGWLNSKSGRVGRDMEAELWQKTRGFLEELENGETTGVAQADKDVEMT